MRLTAAERDWLDRVQLLLDECPSDRLGFYTIGDPTIVVYDHTKEAKINKIMDRYHGPDFCNAVDEAKAGTGIDLRFPNPVHSTAG